MPAPEDESTPPQPPVTREDDDPVKPDWRSMIMVLIVQAHNVFNDKISQWMLTGLAGVLALQATQNKVSLSGTEMWGLSNYELLAATLMALPYILFAPISGWVADRFSKKTVLIWTFVMQSVVLAWITYWLWREELWIATVGFLFLSIQSTLLSPAKMGICKELVGSRKLAVAVGWMQMLVVLCIIVGTVAGSESFKALSQGPVAAQVPDAIAAAPVEPVPEVAVPVPAVTEDPAVAARRPWLAATYIVGVMFLAAFLPYLLMLFVRQTPVQSMENFQPHMAFEHFSHLGDLFSRRELRLAGLGVTFFWFAGGVVALVLVGAGKEVHPGDGGAAIALTGRLNAAVGLGIVIGSLLVAVVCRRGIELGLVPTGAIGMALSMAAAAIIPPASPFYYVAMSFMGLFAGMFLVPQNALIQDLADPARRGRITSAVNLLNAIAGLLAAAFVGFMRVGLPTAVQFGVMAVLTVFAGIYTARLLPSHFLRFYAKAVTQMIYRIQALNVHNVPKTGGVLMISNHVSYVDAFMISVASPRPVRFVILNHFLDVKAFGWLLRIFDVIPISPTKAKDAIRTTADALKQGSVVCIFPEGQLTRTGFLNELKKGFELIVRQANVPVLPVYMDSLWGSIFSFERFRYFYKVPRQFPFPVTVNFGTLIPPDKVTTENARAAIQDLSVDAFAERKDLRVSLGEAVVRALKRKPGQEMFIEVGKESRRVFKRGLTLSVANMLASRWKREWPRPRQRVAVLLPAGSFAAVVNVAVVLARRVPVNLPIELIGDAARCRKIMEEYGLETIISSRALFPGDVPDGMLDMREELAKGGTFTHLGAVLSRLEPAWVTVRRLGVREYAKDAPAVACVVPGREGRYKLVSLSHQNVLASVYQVDSSLVFLPGDRVMVESSFNRVASILMGLWHPLIKRGTAVYRSLAAQQTRATTIISQEKPQVVILTHNLVEELIVKGEMIDPSVRVLLDFAKQPVTAEQQAALERDGAEYCHCLAPDELGAIVAMNTKDPNSMIPAHLPQTGNREGTVGRLMPGATARILEHGAVRKLWDEGQLVVRGSSFPPGSPTIQIDGQDWIDTGLRGKFDPEGFLTLTSSAPSNP